MSDTWLAKRHCTDKDDEFLFPDKPSKKKYDKTRNALCMRCPVRVQCLEEAFTFEEDKTDRFGMWGSLTPEERTKWHNIWKNTDAATVLKFIGRSYD